MRNKDGLGFGLREKAAQELRKFASMIAMFASRVQYPDGGGKKPCAEEDNNEEGLTMQYTRFVHKGEKIGVRDANGKPLRVGDYVVWSVGPSDPDYGFVHGRADAEAVEVNRHVGPHSDASSTVVHTSVLRRVARYGTEDHPDVNWPH